MVSAPGFLKGYVRRFAQKSHDHRGTPTVRARLQSLIAFLFYLLSQSPGRVVTLVHQEDWAAFSSAVRARKLLLFLTFNNLLFVDFFGRTTGLVPA